MADPANGATPAFLLRGAERRFGEVEALSPTDLTVRAGERVALVGPSGAGKTTLLALLNSTLVPSGGEVSLLGSDPAQLSPRALRATRSRIATIPQHLGLVPTFRAWQNVACGRVGSRGLFGTLRDLFLPARTALTAIHTLLDRVGIEDKLYARTAQLSGGQQQRVAVARALYQQPQAILADEPVSSVDPARAASLVALLAELAEERGLTLVMSLHNLDLARTHFPRLVGLRGGRVMFDAPPAQIDEAQFEALYQLGAEAPPEAGS